MSQTFALTAPVLPVLYRVSCSSETTPIVPKRKEMHENMSLESYGADREHSLQKFPTRLRGTNFCIICTRLARFAPSFMQ